MQVKKSIIKTKREAKKEAKRIPPHVLKQMKARAEAILKDLQHPTREQEEKIKKFDKEISRLTPEIENIILKKGKKNKKE